MLTVEEVVSLLWTLNADEEQISVRVPLGDKDGKRIETTPSELADEWNIGKTDARKITVHYRRWNDEKLNVVKGTLIGMFFDRMKFQLKPSKKQTAQ